MLKYKKNNLFKIKKKKIGKIKIIGGKWKNRKLFITNNYILRPSISLIKKILFNWLNPYIQNSKCIDCFAGSGSLGLEALSRNAKSVFFLENNINIFKQLKKNLNLFNYYNNVIYIDVFKWLNFKKMKYFNIIFLDPPFGKNLINKIIFLLEKKKYLSNKTLIYIETEKKNIINFPNNWYIKKKKTVGNISIYLCLYLNI
ncbi:16S rRNA (guanine(966)-N(2))-methyltransferase RsmD [Enterobacterales bacterium endosymbiont of Anomoneura mori]|uniref:16S rRNA (guanine(966)-N(2))-methyltransferase RsmD n=1 Tax=Enterobacterales bacterium endosymbiont of Anomoneura mori TaxID=3132096 RepID=UPI00399D0F5E